ncbi:hypothetical protein ACQ143_00115 [Microbacterium sp. MC2]
MKGISADRARPGLSFRQKLALLGVASFIFASGIAGGYTAFAASVESSLVKIEPSQAGGCIRVKAKTVNTSGGYGQIYSTSYAAGFPSGCASAQTAGHFGGNAFLKKTSGAICSSIATWYSGGTTIYNTRNAVKAGSSCPSGQLSGGGRAYLYTGSAYTSKVVQAPYLGM